MNIKFTIYGKPLAQKRPRFFRAGKGIRSYDPDKELKNEFARIAKEYAPDKPFECPITIIIITYWKRPKSHYRTGKYSNELKPNAPIYKTSKPDVDNLFKFVGDAFNGVFWKDDSYIINGKAIKIYTEGEEKTEIEIETIEYE